MRLKPGGLRYLDISGNFNAILRFCYVILYGVYIPVFLCGVYTGISVRFYGVRTPLSLDFCLIWNSITCMHVKVSCKGIDTETDLSVFIHATIISSTENVTSMLK